MTVSISITSFIMFFSLVVMRASGDVGDDDKAEIVPYNAQCGMYTFGSGTAVGSVPEKWDADCKRIDFDHSGAALTSLFSSGAHDFPPSLNHVNFKSTELDWSMLQNFLQIVANGKQGKVNLKYLSIHDEKGLDAEAPDVDDEINLPYLTYLGADWNAMQGLLKWMRDNKLVIDHIERIDLRFPNAEGVPSNLLEQFSKIPYLTECTINSYHNPLKVNDEEGNFHIIVQIQREQAQEKENQMMLQSMFDERELAYVIDESSEVLKITSVGGLSLDPRCVRLELKGLAHIKEFVGLEMPKDLQVLKLVNMNMGWEDLASILDGLTQLRTLQLYPNSGLMVYWAPTMGLDYTYDTSPVERDQLLDTMSLNSRHNAKRIFSQLKLEKLEMAWEPFEQLLDVIGRSCFSDEKLEIRIMYDCKVESQRKTIVEKVSPIFEGFTVSGKSGTVVISKKMDSAE